MSVIEGMIIAALRRRRRTRATSTSARSTPWPSSACSIAIARREELRPAGRQHPGHRLLLPSAHRPRRGRVRLRRGHRADWPPSRASAAMPRAKSAAHRRARVCSTSPPCSTTWRPTPTSPRSSATAADMVRYSIGTGKVQGHQGLRPGAARSATPAWWRCPWARRCARSSTTSAAACTDGKKFKAVQTGGPSGGCIPASHLDVPLDFDSLNASRRHDGLRRHDRHGRGHLHGGYRALLPELHAWMNPAASARPAASGTKRMLEILDAHRRTAREAWRTLILLEELCRTITRARRCAVWARPRRNPVLSTLKYFRNEYVAHVVDHHCPIGNVHVSAVPVIKPELCKGCAQVHAQLPDGGHFRRDHVCRTRIDTRKVHPVRRVHGATCPFGAIVRH